jgi:hypothetical protein
MSGLNDDTGRVAGIVLAVVLVAAAIGGGIYAMRAAPPPPPPPAPVAAPAPAPAASAAVAPAPVAEQCSFPGPVPALPRGEVATADDMKTQHDAIQGFVKALEVYQSCFDQKVKNAPPGTDDQTKQRWLAEGNRAVDMAHALADAFAEQMKIFKARTPEAPPPAPEK